MLWKSSLTPTEAALYAVGLDHERSFESYQDSALIGIDDGTYRGDSDCN